MTTIRLASAVLLTAVLPVSAGDYAIAGAHVVESDEASYQLRKAKKAVEGGKWTEAVSLLLGVLETWPDSVCSPDDEGGGAPAGGGAGKSTLYVGTVDYVRRRLLALPPEGRRAFRTLYDAKVDTMFALASASRDRGALAEIADTYFLATRGGDACWLLARLHREEGRPDLALPLLERMLRLDTAVPPAAVWARIAECQVALGKPDLVSETIEGRDAPLSDRIRVGDGEVSLGEYLARLAERPVARGHEGDAPERYETFGGDAGRNLAMGPDLSLPPRSWAWRVPVSATRRVGGAWGGLVEPPDERDLFPGARSSVIPAVADGAVVLHNDIGVYAFDLVASEPKLLWKYEAALSASQVLPEERVLHTITVHDGIAYANLVATVERQEQQLDFLVVRAPIPYRALMAFSMRTGKLLWTIGGRKDTKDPKLRASFQAAPAAEHGRLYVGAVFQERPTDPVQQHVFCLDALTGEVIWRRYVAEAYLEMNLFNNPTREIVGSSVTVDGDTVYYCTNSGIIAALEKETGKPRWLRRYEQFRIPPTRDLYVPPMPSGWENNPIVAWGDTLLVAPMDSPYLYVLSATSGDDRAKTKLSRDTGVRSPISGMLWLLGVQGDRLVLSSRDRVSAIDVRTMKLKWEWRPVRNPRSPDAEMIVGRGGLSRGTAYVPCASGLYRLDLATDRPDGAETGYEKWIDPKRDGGNVVVVDNTVVTTSASTLSVFFSREMLSAWLDRELAAAPEDPLLRLRVARSLASAGRTGQAVTHLEKALQLAASSGDPAAERAAEEARGMLVSIHRGLGEELLSGGKADAAAAEFREAARLAGDAAERVKARRDLARALAAAGKAREAVAELSRVILEDPEAPADGGRAWDAARLDIAKVVELAGQAAYAEQEAQAQARLDAAGDAEQATAEVIRLWPNSRAAEEAAWRLAQIAERDGRLEDAATRLRGFLRDWPDSARLAQAHVNLAECYRKRGMEAKARIVLRQAARRIGGEKVVVGGKETTVEAYLAEVLGAGGAAAATPLPDVPWPVDRAWEVSERRSDALRVLAASGDPPAGAEALVLVAAGKRLRAVAAVGGEVRWEREFGSDPIAAGWTEGGLVVALERDGVAAVDGANGRVLWVADLPGFLLASAVGRGAAYVLVADRGNMMRQRLAAVSAKDGRELWTLPLADRQAGNEVWMTEDSLVLAATGGDGRALLVVDRDSGELVHSIAIDGGIGRLLLLPPNQVAVVTGDRDEDLRAFSLATGQMSWMASATRIRVETLATNGLQIAYVAVNPSGADEVVVVDAESGRVAARAPIGTQDYVKGGAIDDQNLYVSFREATQTRSIYVRAFSLSDASTRWRANIVSGEAYFLFPMQVARGAVIVPTPLRKDDDRDNPFVPVFTAVGTKAGEVEQQSRLSVRGKSPPETRVLDGVVLVTQGNRLYGLRGAK